MNNLDIYEHISKDPYNEQGGELRFSSSGMEFILPRKKRGRKYKILFEVLWDEVLAYDCSEIQFCKDEKTWPLNEQLPDDYSPVGTAGMFFVFMRAKGEAYFQIWAIIPQEDIQVVSEIASKYVGRDKLSGLAHHGTTAAVRLVLNNCNVIERLRLKWHDWVRRGPSIRPRAKFKELDPELVFCKEGMAIDFFGASPKLEQMSTFWPWRVIRSINILDSEVPEIAFIWHEDSYTFRLQVWDDEDRKAILDAARNALETYRSSDDVSEMKLIRPWSFPSTFYETWDDLKPNACKASREGFPPIFEE